MYSLDRISEVPGQGARVDEIVAQHRSDLGKRFRRVSPGKQRLFAEYAIAVSCYEHKPKLYLSSSLTESARPISSGINVGGMSSLPPSKIASGRSNGSSRLTRWASACISRIASRAGAVGSFIRATKGSATKPLRSGRRAETLKIRKTR